MERDEVILESVLTEFAAIAKIPRPSWHEAAVSAYLCERLRALGLSAVQDAAMNVIAEISATPGYETAPRTILQGHMDMVCVAESGRAYDPLKDPITLVREGDCLRADGTSLGADNGAGVAEILYLVQHLPAPHGPVRVIFTTDEEAGMHGAQALDAKYLMDAAFCINCDSEEDGIITIGSAGGIDILFSRAVTWQAAPAGIAWRLSVDGLAGGHSGECIGTGRANALALLGGALHALSAAAPDLAVATMEGGSARNAIAASASAMIVTQADAVALQAALQTCCTQAQKAYAETEPHLTMTLVPADFPAEVMAEADWRAVAELLTTLHSGVFAMSPSMPTLVETSANLGKMETRRAQTESVITFTYFPRSSVHEKLVWFGELATRLAHRFGCTAKTEVPTPAWHERPDSVLLDIMKRVFREQRGEEVRVASIHAGLETGFLVARNPQLDVVSIGVTTFDIHSPRERLLLSTVAPQVRLIYGALAEIAKL